MSEVPARRILRNRALLALASGPLLLYLPLLAMLARGRVGEFLMLLSYPALLACVTVFSVAKKNPKPRVVEGTVTVTETELLLPDGARVARSKLRQGFVTTKPDGSARVNLFGPLVPIELEVDDEERGRQLLVALELDTAQTTVTMMGQSHIASWSAAARVALGIGVWVPSFVLLLLSIFGLSRSHPGLGLMILAGAGAAFVAAIGAILLGTRPKRITIGTDGVETSWLGRTRFIAYADIAGVELLQTDLGTGPPRGVELRLEDGETVRLPLVVSNLTAGEAERLRDRIVQAKRVHEGGARAGASPALRVEGETSQIRTLRKMAAGATGGHRDAAVDGERWIATLEDAGAPATDRAKAAFVLGAMDASHRPRILQAARRVALPQLRVAFERAAEPDVEEAAIVEALEALDARAARRR